MLGPANRRLAAGVPSKLFVQLTRRALSGSSQPSLLKGKPLLGPEICKVPLSEPVPGLPQAIYQTPSSIKDSETKVTVMKNGLRVASEKKFGQFCIVGVAINSGSRVECSYPSGVSHFIERSAFRSTQKFSNRNEILETLSHVGGTVDCQGSRDLMLYAVSVMKEHLETAVDLLGEAVLRPRFPERDVSDTANRISFELQDLARDPERKGQLSEMIHEAAYGSGALGRAKICPEENLSKITPELMYNFLKHNHTPGRMVLAGVNVDHDRLIELAERYFVNSPSTWDASPSLVSPEPNEILRPPARYFGGLKAIEADLSNVSLGPTPLPNLVHLQLGFEVCSHLELDEFVVVCVLNMLMGGGGSFSAGGPGKGMYTRLFTSVLNQYHWVQSCAAHNQAYEDSGLFFIQASSDPSLLRNLVDIVIKEFRNLVYGRIDQEELARAKKQLISMLWLNLEIRAIIFEDVARQVLSSGFRREPKQLIEKIENVTEDDIRAVATKMLTKKPAIACLGDLRHLPSLDYFQSRISAPASG